MFARAIELRWSVELLYTRNLMTNVTCYKIIWARNCIANKMRFSELPREAPSSLLLGSFEWVQKNNSRSQKMKMYARVSVCVWHATNWSPMWKALRFKVIRYTWMCVYRSSNGCQFFQRGVCSRIRLCTRCAFWCIRTAMGIDKTTTKATERKKKNNQKPKGKINQTKQNKIQTKKSAIPSLSVFALIHYNFLAIYGIATLRYAIIIILPCSIYLSHRFFLRSSYFISFHLSVRTLLTSIYTHTRYELRFNYQVVCLLRNKCGTHGERWVSLIFRWTGLQLHTNGHSCAMCMVLSAITSIRGRNIVIICHLCRKRGEKNCTSIVEREIRAHGQKNRAIKMRRILKCNTDFFNFII